MKNAKVLIPALAYAAIVFTFVYKEALGEPDLEEMALAVLYQSRFGEIQEGYAYGISFSYGWYWLMGLLHHTNSTELIALINWSGYASAVIGLALLGLYLNRIFGERVALVTTVVFAFSPLFLEIGTSGHPIMLAFALYSLGALCLTYRFLWPASIIAFAAALTMRADIALGLAFVAIASSKDLPFKALVLAAMPRIAIVTLSLVLFLILQRNYSSSPSEEFLEFVRNYYKFDRLVAGSAVTALAAGLASCLIGAYAIIRTKSLREWLLALMLIVPTLVFWLPNATPARHMIFVVLGVALLIGIFAARVSVKLAAATTMLAIFGNQALAEATHPLIVNLNEWDYPSLTERRSIYRVPMSSFPIDHAANQENFSYFRLEGTGFYCKGRVLIFADSPMYLQLSMVDDGARMKQIKTLGYSAQEVTGPCLAHIVQRSPHWPKDIVPEFLANSEYGDWKIYFQEIARAKYDKARIPPERLFVGAE